MSITIWCRIKREELKRARRLKAVTALEAWTRRPKKGAKREREERAAAFSFTLDGPSRDSQDIWDRLNVLLGKYLPSLASPLLLRLTSIKDIQDVEGCRMIAQL